MEKINTWIESIGQYPDMHRYLIFLVAVIVLFFIGKLIKRIINRISRKHMIIDNPVYASFLTALANSVTVLLVGFGLAVGFAILSFPESWQPVVQTTKEILIVLAIGYFVWQVVDVPTVWFESIIDKRKSESLNKMFVPVIRKTLRLLVIILILIQIIQIVSDQTITTIVAGLGIGSLAIALAAQDTLKHFIGSFVIAGDKPFEIGDRVVVDGHDGPIESIGLRSTLIRTLEGHLVAIPNGELANRTIQNIGKRPHIRRLANITITYDTPTEKIQEAIDIIKDVLKDHEGMHPEFPPRVYFSEFNSDSLNLMVLYWYHPPDYWAYMEFSEKVNFEIFSRFNEAGIDFAFPTKTLYLAGDDKRPLDFGLSEQTKKELGNLWEKNLGNKS
ncbi:MAG: mechanosensitive ion channel family protein [Bacteroidales bacterium]